MQEFDTEKVKNSIEKSTIDENNHPLCKINILHTPQNHIPYIKIFSSYEVIKNVLIEIHGIAAKYELQLFDAEAKRTFFKYDLYDKNFVNAKNRAAIINKAIQISVKSVWELKKIYFAKSYISYKSAYVVTLLKDKNLDLNDRIINFYDLLKSTLIEGEELYTNNRCFTIYGDGYQISYCLEAYKKSADRICYFENGEPQSRLNRRMSMHSALQYFDKLSQREKDVVLERMSFDEMTRAYPNPADRFVRSINISKELSKEKFDVRYVGIGEIGFAFHRVPTEESNNSPEISCLKIDEDVASFILPIANDFYPYIYTERYYESNYIPKQAFERIIDRMKHLKKLILTDTYNSELNAYVESFDLWCLDPSYDRNESKTDIVYRYRFDIAHLYDMFIAWGECQLEYCSHSAMINIQGP